MNHPGQEIKGATMEKIDFKKSQKEIYTAPKGDFAEIVLPRMSYLMIDGAGDPNTAPAYAEALGWLYPVSFAMKFAARAELGRDYVVPPLEGLWWAEDPADFVARAKHRWHWTLMIRVPDFVTEGIFAAAVDKARSTRGTPPASLRRATLDEGLCLQTLHIGSYDDEGPTLARLHDVEMPARGLTFNGPHHEIYLSDPRRTAPERLRTILRQPVRPHAARLAS